MLLECLPQADTLGVAAPTHKHHVQMLPDVVQPCLGVIVSNATVRAKGDLPPLPPTVRDNLLRHSLRWKLVSTNSLSMPRGMFGGTTTVRRGGSADPKADKAAGKCSSSFLGVYKGTQPSVVWNSSGGAVSQPVVLLQVRHPVISYYVGRIPFRRRRAKSELW